MATKPSKIGEWIKAALRSEPPRSKSLIVTIFGDSIAPHSDGLWLSELIELLEPFHANERLVRTSSFRLIEEGWLVSRKDGRRSRYSLTPYGIGQLEHAHDRIYEPPPAAWDGSWTLVILSKAGNAVVERVELRRQLEWEGFGLLAPNIFLHPAPDLSVVDEKLAKLDLSNSAVVIHARDADLKNIRPLARLVDECWSLGDVDARYRQFVRRFEPLEALLNSTQPGSLPAFVAQTLLIHAYRRSTLHDPRLPIAMLPSGWKGQEAYELCKRIYGLTRDLSRKHLATHLSDSPKPIDEKPRFKL